MMSRAFIAEQIFNMTNFDGRKMNTKFETNFTVMPTHCNYRSPMIFGGAFFSKMDLCAAACTSRLLFDSKTADYAVTHKVLELTFHKPTGMGDIIYLEAEIVELRKKAITVIVKAYREKRNAPGKDFVADGKFVFIAMRDDNYVDHDLSMKGE